MTDISDRYDPNRVETRWYETWESRGYFHADPASPKRPYCIVIPPPNVTGSLHWGHALNNTLQDILIRYKRMDGYEAARQMRRTEWGQRALLAALTGWGQSEDRAKVHEAGFDRHLVKPVDHDQLQALVAAVKPA